MEPLGYLRLIRRRWRLLVACAVVAAVAVAVVTPSEPRGGQVTWVAEAQLIGDGTTTVALPSVQLTVRTGEVPSRAAARLDYTENPRLLARSVTVEVDETVGTLTLSAPGPSPRDAAETANVFASETIALLAERANAAQQARLAELEVQVNQLQTQLADIDRQIRQATSSGGSLTLLDAQQSAVQAQYGAAFSELQKAVTAPPASPGLTLLVAADPELATVQDGGFSAPRSRPARAAFGGIGGLLLGIALVLVIARFDPRLLTREEVERAFALPVIATVPDEPLARNRFEVFTLTEPGSSMAEGYRSLRAALLLMPSHLLSAAPLPGAAPTPATARDADTVGSEPGVIVVTSAAPGDGKSVTVANVAVAIAETGRSVLVLGCDFRRPSIHRYFGVSGRGVMDVLRGLDKDGPKLRDVTRSTAVPGVSIVPHGTGAETFGDVAASGRRLLDEARALADIVIVDTPPLLVTNDAVELIPGADTTVIVCRSNKTTKDAATRSRDLLERLGASVGGIVLIGADEPETSRYHDYYHYRKGTSKHRRRRWLPRRS